VHGAHDLGGEGLLEREHRLLERVLQGGGAHRLRCLDSLPDGRHERDREAMRGGGLRHSCRKAEKASAFWGIQSPLKFAEKTC
jgi:hypothetical protein